MKAKPSATSHERQLEKLARTVARLQFNRRRVKKHLKDIETELKHARKLLRVYAQFVSDLRQPQPTDPPMRLYGEHK